MQARIHRSTYPRASRRPLQISLAGCCIARGKSRPQATDMFDLNFIKRMPYLRGDFEQRKAALAKRREEQDSREKM